MSVTKKTGIIKTEKKNNSSNENKSRFHDIYKVKINNKNSK